VNEGQIEVEVVYALPLVQHTLRLRVAVGTTVGQALARAAVVAPHFNLDFARSGVAVFGRLVSADTRLREGDRIEILRPLKVDPKEARKRRAALARGGR